MVNSSCSRCFRDESSDSYIFTLERNNMLQLLKRIFFSGDNTREPESEEKSEQTIFTRVSRDALNEDPEIRHRFLQSALSKAANGGLSECASLCDPARRINYKDKNRKACSTAFNVAVNTEYRKSKLYSVSFDQLSVAIFLYKMGDLRYSTIIDEATSNIMSPGTVNKSVWLAKRSLRADIPFVASGIINNTDLFHSFLKFDSRYISNSSYYDSYSSSEYIDSSTAQNITSKASHFCVHGHYDTFVDLIDNLYITDQACKLIMEIPDLDKKSELSSRLLRRENNISVVGQLALLNSTGDHDQVVSLTDKLLASDESLISTQAALERCIALRHVGRTNECYDLIF